MDKYRQYDLIVASTLSEIYNEANKNNNTIVLAINQKNLKNKSFLYYYEIVKICQTCYNTKVIVNCNIINYLFFILKFKIKKYKVKIKRDNSQKSNDFSLLLNKVLLNFSEDNKFEIFSEIYDTYYNIKNLKVIK